MYLHVLLLGVVFLCTNHIGAQKLFSQDIEDCFQDLDVMIILDGSSSVTHANFELVKTWVKSLAVGLHIDHGHVQIGVVQYSSFYDKRPLNRQRYIKTEIELGEFSNDLDFNVALDAIEYQNGKKTYTAKAIEKTVQFDFYGGNNRYPEARRTIVLLTDGKARDSDDLYRVIELAHDAGAYIIPIGVGDFNHDELVLLAHNHTTRVFEVENFDDLSTIVSDVHYRLRIACYCDLRGSVDEDCDPCTSQCKCRPSVGGLNCDECLDGFFGFNGPNGCESCECDLRGMEPDTVCDKETGQCQCREGVTGLSCTRCEAGYYSFPECIECECNGFAWECNNNGICLNCSDGRIGDHCERCGPGTYWMPRLELCEPCPCNGFIDDTDLDSCDPVTGECLKCLDNRSGKYCERCAKFYFNSTLGDCTLCDCDAEGTAEGECNFFGMCECNQDTGSCKCAPNVIGDKCESCAPGYTSLEAGVGCVACHCDEVGTSEQSLCDPITGDCKCSKNHMGRHCRECKRGFSRSDLQSECLAITTTAATTKLTTTVAPANFKSSSSLRINPKWSPCVGCGRGYSSWPSYCRGWTCKRRWPYYEQHASPIRCSPYNWGCRSNVDYYSSYGNRQYGSTRLNLYRPNQLSYYAPNVNRRSSSRPSHMGIYRS